jgi:putative chitinase
MWSEALVRELFPRGRDEHVEAFAAQGPGHLDRSGIGARRNRLHFFLAQIGHESAGLTVVEENMSYSAERIVAVWPSRFASVAEARPFARNPEALANRVYGGRMGNRGEASGDGWRYRGRGYIQLTGRDGYRRVGDIVGLDLEGEPDLAARPEHALLAACGFWQWKGLNALCDGGDFTAVTRRVNGGTIGLEDRRRWLDKVRRTLASPPDASRQPPAEVVVAVQRALQARGYPEVGAADGIIGPRTAAAIGRFREDHGLPEGLIDRRLLKALGVAD